MDWRSVLLVGALAVVVEVGVVCAGEDEVSPDDRERARAHARAYAEEYAALRAGLGPEVERERVATVQPHYAVTHRWVQRPMAHAGWPAPPPPRLLRVRRAVVIERHPIVVPRRPVVPWRPWRPPPRFHPRPPRRW